MRKRLKNKCPYPWRTPDGRSNPKAYRWYRQNKKDVHQRAGRRSRLKNDFGITEKEYDQMLRLQGSCCAICWEPESIPGRRLAVDHDRESGAVRGMLCFRCNRALGGFKDSTEFLRRAIEYLAPRNKPHKRGRADRRGLAERRADQTLREAETGAHDG